MNFLFRNSHLPAKMPYQNQNEHYRGGMKNALRLLNRKERPTININGTKHFYHLEQYKNARNDSKFVLRRN